MLTTIMTQPARPIVYGTKTFRNTLREKRYDVWWKCNKFTKAARIGYDLIDASDLRKMRRCMRPASTDQMWHK